MKKWEVSRRTFLKGLGTMIALPVLDAMIPSIARAATPTQRFGVVYFPSGMYGGSRYGGKSMGSWVPSQNGSLLTQPTPIIIEPMKGLLTDFSILSGLDIRAGEIQVAGGEGDHARAGCTFLVCTPKKQRSVVDIDTSMDQLIAQHLNRTGTFRVQSLITAGSAGGNYDGPHPDYCGHISYANRIAVPKYANPQKCFDALFSGFNNKENTQAEIERAQHGKSILDFVRSDTASLKRKLGRADNLRLEEFLESLRQIERDLASLPLANQAMCSVPGRPADSLNVNYLNPLSYTAGLNVFVDMMVASFQCDLTPVSTLMLEAEGSDRLLEKTIIPSSYKDIVVRERAHNDNAHWQGDPERVERLISINRYQLSFFERLTSKMKAIQEPTGTLLDNSILMYGCGISDGGYHSHRNVPLLLAGGKNLGLRPGRHMSYGGKPLANLHLSIMKKMGLNVSSFADSTGTLDDI